MRIAMVLLAILWALLPQSPAVVGAQAASRARIAGTNTVLQAALTVSANAITPGQAMTFSYSATSLDSTDPIRTLTLDFGDGQAVQLPIGSTGMTSGTIDYTYTQAQSYPATLTVLTSQEVSVTATAALSGPTSDTTDAPVGQSITSSVGVPISFTATGSTENACGSIAQYTFDFGDGSPPVIGQTASHTYQEPGTYTMLLTVTDCAGVTASSQSTVTVLPAP